MEVTEQVDTDARLQTVDQIRFARLGVVEKARERVMLNVGAAQVLLETAYLGICGSDLHVLHGKHPWVKPPLVTGHEVSARVVAVGEGVTRVCVGDHAVINPLVWCGVCDRCAKGWFNRCEAAKVIGFRIPGAGQSRFVVGEQQVHRVPSSVPLHIAGLTEPLAVGVHAAKRWNELDNVLIIGGGTIGLCVLLALRVRGAKAVTVIEPTQSKRELALRLGASGVAHPDDFKAEPKHTVSFDCVGFQSTLDTACAATMTGGAVVAVGVPPGAMSIPLPRMQRFEIALVGSGMYLPDDIDQAIALLVSGEIDVSPLISRVFSLDDVVDSYEVARQADSVKILVDFST